MNGPAIAQAFWRPIQADLNVYGWRAGGALAVVILTFAASRLVSSRVRGGLARTSLGPNPTVLLARVARSGVYFIGLLWVLAIFSVSFTALAAVVSVAALAISLSLQDLLKNLIAGIYLLAERPFHIGDRITVSGVTGVIDDIQMRVTYLRSDGGERIVMPNQTVFTQIVVNNTVAGGFPFMLMLEFPRSILAEEIQTLVAKVASGLSVPSARSVPQLEPAGATPETTSWRLSLWLSDEGAASEMIAGLMVAAPQASIVRC